MGTYKEIDGLRYTMEQLQNSGEKDQFPAGKGDLVTSFKYIEDYMNQNCHPNTTLGAALNGDGLLTDHGVEHVKMVIQNAGKLVGDMQYKRLNGYEIYLLLLAIHFHDVGNVCGRQEHEKKIDDLLSFLRFVVPVFKDLINLPGFRQNANIYFFIDDADNLSITQTKILNTWIACRTQPTISLKVSAQYELYKTYLTSNDILIESPHDYQSVNISLRYTTNYIGKFKDKAIEILAKRLSSAGIEQPPEEFFPTYSTQEDGIQREIQRIRDNYTISGRGTRVDDDIRRYAIPNYIKKLGGTKKSRSTFRYAGLENMIHLSSGIIRNLLDAAANMYDAARAQCGKDTPIAFIDTGIQNRVLRNQSDAFLYTELRHSNTGYENASELQPIASPKNDIEKLQNLICAMGQTFHDILVSDRSERKVFSIALSNAPDDEIKRVLKTGVRLGYLHEATIGNKAGNGRTWLYILNRRLAPSFVLDPTGFQGYLFMTNDDLHRAMTTGRQLRVIDDRLDGDVEQLSLFDIWED